MADDSPVALKPPALGLATNAALKKALSTPGGRDDFKALFGSLDSNGDGALSSKEWGKGVGTKWNEDDGVFKEMMQKYALTQEYAPQPLSLKARSVST